MMSSVSWRNRALAALITVGVREKMMAAALLAGVQMLWYLVAGTVNAILFGALTQVGGLGNLLIGVILSWAFTRGWWHRWGKTHLRLWMGALGGVAGTVIVALGAEALALGKLASVCLVVLGVWAGALAGLLLGGRGAASMSRVLQLVSVGFVMIAGGDTARAHNNILVHPAAAVKAATLLLQTGVTRYDEVFRFRGNVGDRSGEDDIQEGTINEDEGILPSVLAALTIKPARHFYNPQTGAGLLGFDTALVRGLDRWGTAVTKYKSGDRARAYFHLGEALHLIQDMTSPPHVHNDIHFDLPFLPPIFNFNDYENAEKDFFEASALAYPGRVGALTPPTTDYGALLVATAKQTNEDVRIAGQLQRIKATPAAGDLATLFPPIAYLQYVPQEVSETTFNLKEHWHMAGVGDCFSGPEGSSQFADDDWWRAAPIGPGQEFYYIENVRNAIPANVWNVTTSTYEANASNIALPALWAGIPSQPNLRATPTQAGLLVPRTIEAGAGLLQLFESSVTLRVVVSSPTETRPLTRVSGTQPVTVNFDRPVDIGTAILGQTVVVYSSVTPLAGTLSWNASRTTMTFVPTGGWPVDNFFTLDVKADDVMTTDVVEGVRGADGSVLTKRFLLPFKNVGLRFFVAENTTTGNLYGFKLDGTLVTTVAGLSSPAAVAYDEDTGFLYVTEFGEMGTSHIAKLKVDGSARSVLPLTFAAPPDGLYFDPVTRLLYGTGGLTGFALFRTDENGSSLAFDVNQCPAVVGGVQVLLCTDEFYLPQGLTGRAGVLYVTDSGNHTVMEKTFGGAKAVTVVGQMKTAGSGANQLNGPYDVAVDTSGKLVVADTFNNRVIRCGGGACVVLPAPGGGYTRPRGVWVNPETNDIYVADTSNLRIVKISGTTAKVLVTKLLGPWPIDGGGVPDSAFPVGSPVTVEQSTVTFRWTTTEPADSLVRYSPSSLLGGATEVLVPALVVDHVVAVTGLSPLTTYYYQVVTRDAARNALIYPIQSVLTQEVITGMAPGAFLRDGTTVVVANVSGRVGQAEFFLDGGLQHVSTASPFQWVAAGVVDGVRALSTRVTTTGGAVVRTTFSVTADNSGPTTFMGIGRPQTLSGGTTVVTPQTQVTFRGFDAGGGVATVTYRVDGGLPVETTGNFAGPLTLVEGVHAVAARSADALENLESFTTQTVVSDGRGPGVDVFTCPRVTGPAGSLFVASSGTVIVGAVDRGPVLFADNFDTALPGTVPPGWTIAAGSWTATEGEFRSAVGGVAVNESLAFALVDSFTDYRLEARVRTEFTSEPFTRLVAAGLIFRMPTVPGPRGQVDGYQFTVGPARGALVRFNGGVRVVLATGSVAGLFVQGEAVTAAVEVTSGTIRGYLNDVLILSTTDTTYLTGHVGLVMGPTLEEGGAAARFDDVRVTALPTAGVAGFAVGVNSAPGAQPNPVALVLTGEGPHTITAQAVDRLGQGTIATTTVVVDGTPPPPVTRLEATGRPLGAIALAWAAVTDAGIGLAEYQVLATTQVGDLGTLRRIGRTTDTTFVDPGTGGPEQHGEVVAYRVAPVDRLGNVDVTTGTVVVIARDVQAPASVTDLVATAGEQVTLAWTAPGSEGTSGTAVAYRVRWATAAMTTDAEFVAATEVLVAPPQVTGTREVRVLTGLLPRTTLYFAVEAENAAGRGGALSNSSSARSGILYVGQTLTGTQVGALAWGDLDGDGQLDLAQVGFVRAGFAQAGPSLLRVYKNVNGTLVPFQDLEPGGGLGPAAWGDFDRDGDLDLAVSGLIEGQGLFLKVYRNDGGRFVVGQAIGGLGASSLAWADVDQDGDLDLAISGTDFNGGVRTFTRLYRNDGGVLVALPDLNDFNGTVAWGDFNQDGRMDLLVSGQRPDGTGATVVFLNQDGVLGPAQVIADGVAGALAVADVDQDGDLDFALSGTAFPPERLITRVYLNTGAGTFVPGQTFDGGAGSALAWGDVDQDGVPDLVVTGAKFAPDGVPRAFARLYHNAGGTLVEDQALSGFDRPSVAFADVDRDGDLDLVIGGRDINDVSATRLYLNAHAGFGLVNAPPSPPMDLSASFSTTTLQLTLSWNNGTDDKTPAAGLYYAIRVGTHPGGNERVSGEYGSPLLGTYLRPRTTGGFQRVLQDMASDATYYWAVRTIDGGLAASVESVEQTVNTHVPPAPVTDFEAGFSTQAGSILLSWTAPGDDGTRGAIVNGRYWIRYDAQLPLATINLIFSTNTTPGARESRVVSGLTQGTTYFFQMRTGDEVPNFSEDSNLAMRVAPRLVTSTDTVLVAGVPQPVVTFVADATTMTVSVVSTTGAVGTVALATAGASGLALVSNLYNVTADTFSAPAVLVFRYDPANLSFGVLETELRIYQFNTVAGAWELVPDQALDTAAHLIVVRIPALKSIFAVFGPDRVPPTAALLSPDPRATGVGAVVSGLAPVTGTVADDRHLTAWRVEVATGVAPAVPGPFIVVLAGTLPVSAGTLGVWDTRTSTGPVTVRLTAEDGAGNVTRSTAAVFVGAPALVQTLGPEVPGITEGKKASTLRHPEAADVGPDGTRWVADTGRDRVLAFRPDGTLRLVVGELDQDDDLRVASGVVRVSIALKEPGGLRALADGGALVADTGQHRLVALSSAGVVRQVLGQINKEGKCQPGTGPGAFNHPRGVDVDASGTLYVADTENHRFQVLSATGTPLLSVPLARVPEVDDGDDEDGKATGEMQAAQPIGIVRERTGPRVYVSERESGQVFIFTLDAGVRPSTATLTGTLGGGPGTFKTPWHLAGTVQGQVYIAERNANRIRKFDRFGAETLAFGVGPKDAGGQEAAPTNDKTPDGTREFVRSTRMNKPTGVGVGPGGELAVAVRNDDRVKVFDAPAVATAGGPEGPPLRAAPPRPARDLSALGPPHDFALGPNPARAGAPVSIYYVTGWSNQEAECRVYTAAGELVCDGQGPGGQEAAPTRVVWGSPAWAPGRYAVSWSGRNEVGTPLASGVYLIQMKVRNLDTSEVVPTLKKVVVIR